MTYSTRVARYVDASPAAVYRALVDPDAVARWRVPDGMSAQVHHLDAREGGTSRVVVVHEGVPDAISPVDNEVGTTSALARLAALVERGR